MKKKNFDSPFFGSFPSERTSKETKDAKVHFFIHSSALSANLVYYSSDSGNIYTLLHI